MKSLINCIRYFLIPVFLIFVFWGCSDSKKKAGMGSSTAPLQVEAMIVKPRYFESKFEVNANLLPYEETDLKAPVSGNVLSIHFK